MTQAVIFLRALGGSGLGRMTGTTGIGFVPCDASLGFGNQTGQQAQSPLCPWDTGGAGSPLSQSPTAYKSAFLSETHRIDTNRVGIQRHKGRTEGRHGHPSGLPSTEERNEETE